MTDITKLTSEELDQLTDLLRERRRQTKGVDTLIKRIDRDIAAIEEMEGKLAGVVRAYLPDQSDAKVVVQSIEQWLAYAKTGMVAEKVAEKESLINPAPEMEEEVIDEETKEPEDRNRFETPVLTNWLLLALTGLQIGSIILLTNR